MIDKKTALAWLDLQRDAVNTEIVYAAQDEKKQYHENLKIINWVAEAARIHGGEMAAVEFLERWNEMCKNSVCETCPIAAPPTAKYYQCGYVVCSNPRRAVEIVKKWKEEREE